MNPTSNFSCARAATGKALPAVLTVVQLVAMVAVVVWAVMLKRDLATAETELVELRRRPLPDDRPQRENQLLREQIAALEVEVATLAVNAAAAAKPIAPTVSAAPTLAPANAALAALANNPAMRAMIASRQKQTLQTRYAEFFARYQFTPEQRDRFLDILSEGQSAATDAGMKAIGGNLSLEEQAALRQQMKNVTDGVELKLKEFLGDEKHAAYKQYTDLQTERVQVNALRATLAQSGQPLAPEQASALAQIMYTERKSTSVTRVAANDPTNPLAVPSAEVLAAQISEQEMMQNRIAERAATVLTPEQLAALRREQAKRLETMKTSTEMARQLLGGAGKQ